VLNHPRGLWAGSVLAHLALYAVKDVVLSSTCGLGVSVSLIECVGVPPLVRARFHRTNVLDLADRMRSAARLDGRGSENCG